MDVAIRYIVPESALKLIFKHSSNLHNLGLTEDICAVSRESAALKSAWETFAVHFDCTRSEQMEQTATGKVIYI